MVVTKLSRRMLALREWAPSPPLALSAQELYDLRFCGAGIVIQPSGSGTYQLTPGSIVGSISTPTLRVVIRPKFPIERVFYVIATARRIELSRSLTVLGEQPDLTEGFVGLYINMLAPRLRRGLLKGYRQEKDSLQTIRGRLRTADQARRRYGLPLPVEVSFDEFTEDIPENRLIKASLRALQRTQIESSALRQRINAALAAMEFVADHRYTRLQMPVFSCTRLNEHYRHVLELAALIVQRFELELRDGDRAISGLLFDMNRIFEDFVYGGLDRRLRRLLGPAHRWEHGRPMSLDLEDVLRPEPDLSWWRGAECMFVGDAKYKHTEHGRLGDLYQLLAYCSAADLPTGLLIYAEQPAGPAEHRVVRGGPRLRVTALDVTDPVSQIELRLDRLAADIAADVFAPPLTSSSGQGAASVDS
jgi:5-methylcytosine-specific restriction enzyme subunit McrC